MAAIGRGEKTTWKISARLFILPMKVSKSEKSLPIAERPQPTAIHSSPILCCSKLRVFRHYKRFCQTLNNYQNRGTAFAEHTKMLVALVPPKALAKSRWSDAWCLMTPVKRNGAANSNRATMC